MKISRLQTLLTVVLTVSFASFSSASLMLSSEPDCAYDGREFTIELDDGTGYYEECGAGNLSSNAEAALGAFNGLDFILKDEDGWDPTGTIDLADDIWSNYSEVAILLKVGNNDNPTWAIFFVSNESDTAVDYSIGNWVNEEWITSGGGNGLSHYSLYGTPTVVPVPGALVLFGFGLAAIGALRKKNRS